jgi:hypothetical protein
MNDDFRGFRPHRHDHMTVIHSLDDIPVFADEDEEAAFWCTHEFSDELWESLPHVPDDELPPVRKRHVAG